MSFCDRFKYGSLLFVERTRQLQSICSLHRNALQLFDMFPACSLFLDSRVASFTSQINFLWSYFLILLDGDLQRDVLHDVVVYFS